MKLFRNRHTAVAIALCLIAAGQARADQVAWDYNWTPSQSTLPSDQGASSFIKLSNEPGGSAVGNSFIVATNILTVSNADPATPATFTKSGYSLALVIFDEASKQTGSLSFAGELNGALSSKSSIIMNNFTNDVKQSVQIGNHLYTVTIGPFAPPGPPTANIAGSISALANVTVQDVPEPGTLALSGLGMLFGAGWWWKRARGRSLALELA